MINKKIIAVVLCICCLWGFSFSENNFVTISNGGEFTKDFNTLSLGQAVVFSQETDTNVAKSGYPSILMTSKSNEITFTNETEDKIFESNFSVPIKVEIKTNRGTINQIAYQIGNGENPDFNKIDSVEYTGFSKAQTVVFEKNIDFVEGKSVNQFKLWAQYKDVDFVDDSFIIITIKTNGIPADISIESPDPLTRLSSLDPNIKTSKFPINASDVTISLYEGNSSLSGTKLYEVYASSTSDVYHIFDKENSCISYLNSDIMKACGMTQKTTLVNGKEYTLEFKFSNDELYHIDSFTFKAIGGGVADILTYPSPFNPNKEKVKIRYLLAKDSGVTIKIYDKAGKIVCKLIQSEHRIAGTNEEEWNGKNYAGETLATGAYIVEIIAKSSSGEDRRYTALAIVDK